MRSLTWNEIKRNERLHAEAKARFESAWNDITREFGKRQGTPELACKSNCGHPACSQGCTSLGR